MITRENLREIVGEPPQPVALAAEIAETVDCGEFLRFRVNYNVEAGDRIAAFLLVPKDAKRAPAIFCHHQHAGQYDLGKSEVVGLMGDPNQAYGLELARRGFVVLAPDAVGFEERNWSDQPGFAQYHELTSRIVKGQSLLSKVLRDVAVGIDLLEQSEAVDPNRIGFIGHSYGGRMAIWAAAFDDRIKASVSNCGCVGYSASLERTVGIQAEFCVPGIANLLDTPDVVRLISPRALYVSATDDDKYSRGAAELAVAVKETFPASNFLLEIWKGGHVFTAPMRKRAYQFLEKQLSGSE